jgi:hypothetical protein
MGAYRCVLKEPVRKSTREKIAKALGIVPEQLAI